MEERPWTLVLAGPTATGKTAVALELAGRLPIEVVNSDALQVYRGLDIGTAKPSAAERERVPHHLIDILDPSEPFSAGEFRRRALPALREIRRRGRWPLVVGGSGFYLRALMRGLSPIPKVPDEIRDAVRKQAEEEGLESLLEELETRDPETASGLAPGDSQRVQRAVEVVRATGRGLASWWREQAPEPPITLVGAFGLTLPRSVLYDRIARRVDAMFEAGWAREVEELLAGGCLPSDPAFQAIGYRQVVRHLQGIWSREQALEDIKKETRRFAKRQLTWFRAQADIDWIEALEGPTAAERMERALRGRLGE